VIGFSLTVTASIGSSVLEAASEQTVTVVIVNRSTEATRIPAVGVQLRITDLDGTTVYASPARATHSPSPHSNPEPNCSRTRSSRRPRLVAICSTPRQPGGRRLRSPSNPGEVGLTSASNGRRKLH
jgi:hypothetical protein